MVRAVRLVLLFVENYRVGWILVVVIFGQYSLNFSEIFSPYRSREGKGTHLTMAKIISVCLAIEGIGLLIVFSTGILKLYCRF